MKDKIRPIYSELQGYLSQAPSPDKGVIFDSAIWNQHNQTIGELSAVSGKDYSRYEVKVEVHNFNGTPKQMIDSQTYRTKLGGVISRLYGEYFADEAAPFSGMPSTVINQSQTQNQSVHILLEVQSKIDEKLPKLPEGSEKKFLQKIKESLVTVNNVTGLMQLVLKTANDLGITAAQMYKLFT